MSSTTKRQQPERDGDNTTTITTGNTNQEQQQHQATIRSIDETKNNIHQVINELRRETPKYSQAITDFQNQTADATQEIANTFLDSQKELINSFQPAWTAQGITSNIMGTMMMMPFASPNQIAGIYARTIGAMTEAYVASTRMATNGLFAGLEATRATTNYTRQNAKELARVTSNTARAFGHTARESIQNQQ